MVEAQSKDDYESKLSKQEYWESNFQLELQNYEDHGDDGEVWFGKDVQKKTVEYILNGFTDSAPLKVVAQTSKSKVGPNQSHLSPSWVVVAAASNTITKLHNYGLPV